MPKHQTTYTIGALTCCTLPGEQAREYTVHSSAKTINLFDIFVFIFLLVLFQYKPIKYSFCLLFLWLFLKRKTVREESILAIQDIGIQVKTTYWGGSTVSRFINRNKIEDIIINEGISFWQIKSYMAILVKDENKMIVVFEHILPRLDPILLDVYKGTRSIIFTKE